MTTLAIRTGTTNASSRTAGLAPEPAAETGKRPYGTSPTGSLAAARRGMADEAVRDALPESPDLWPVEQLRGLPATEARDVTRMLLIRLHEVDEGTADYSRVRAALVEVNMGLVRHLARRYRRRDCYEDVLQTGLVGLVKAIDAFDPSHGSAFASYAIPTISGEIKRFFRDTTWDLHVARGEQERYMAVMRTADDLQQLVGREVTDDEIAEHLQLTVDEVRQARQADRAHSVDSLDVAVTGPGGTDRSPLADRLGQDEPELDLVDFRVSVTPLISALDPREQTILRMRFWDDMTQREIGEHLGLSQMHVSRLLTRIFGRLREHLETEGSPDPRLRMP